MKPEQEAEIEALLPDKPSRSKRVSVELVRLALKEYRFVRASDGQTYAVLLEGPSLARPLRGEDSFRKQLTNRYFDVCGDVAPSQALADALAVLDARAEAVDPEPVYQRVAPTHQGVLIDLGRPDHLLVEVIAQGWMTRPIRAGDPLLKRSRTLGVMAVPTRSGTLAPLWTLLNVRATDRPLLQGWMAASFLPEVAQPFVLPRGEQGTGKTTAAKLLLTVLDPGPGQLTSPPRNEKDFGVSAQGRTVIGMDNLSAIPPWLSDSICRAVTGESIVSRALYTDDGVAILRYRLGLIITAIDPGALKGDLAERMLPIQLEPLEGRRRSERELVSEFDHAVPTVLGAVMDLVVVALRNMPAVQAPDAGWPRMADFGMVLAALDLQYGTTALASYLDTTTDSELDVIAGDPLADALLSLVTSDTPFTGTATQLMNRLIGGRNFTPEERRGWRTPPELSQSLNRLTRSLRLAGLLMNRRKSGSKRIIELTRTDQDRSGPRTVAVPRHFGTQAGRRSP